MAVSGLADTLRFLRALIARPRHVGAVLPSGDALAAAMARQIDIARPGPVLELGPGTGAITHAILGRGVPGQRLVAVEYDAGFAHRLKLRFPAIDVILGDAFDLDATLGARAPATFAAILSGLPLLNFPQDARKRLLDGVLARLAPGAPFIQFSYGFNPPVPPPDGYRVTRAAFVLRNVPPARVWVYRKI